MRERLELESKMGVILDKKNSKHSKTFRLGCSEKHFKSDVFGYSKTHQNIYPKPRNQVFLQILHNISWQNTSKLISEVRLLVKSKFMRMLNYIKTSYMNAIFRL